MIWFIIGVMAVITFYNRYALMSPRLKITLGTNVQSVLKYTAPAVLTGLWVPIVFVREHELHVDISSPYLIAGLITVLIARLCPSPLITVVLGMLVFMSVRYWL